jgi:hypothetical protein
VAELSEQNVPCPHPIQPKDDVPRFQNGWPGANSQETSLLPRKTLSIWLEKLFAEGLSGKAVNG